VLRWRRRAWKSPGTFSSLTVVDLSPELAWRFEELFDDSSQLPGRIETEHRCLVESEPCWRYYIAPGSRDFGSGWATVA
jgi:hypothetical protein